MTGEEQKFSELDEIIRLQQKAYNLLKWLEKAMSVGFISPKSAHVYMSMSEALEAWILEHLLNLPKESRPDPHNKREMKVFCNLFSSFLDTSFDINEKPGKKLYSDGAHCFCPMCSYLVDVSHLKPKKLTREHKKRAKKMKLDAIVQLCLDEGVKVNDETTEQIVESDLYREKIALIAYADQLLKRSKGISQGPAALSLWRDFAWEKAGSPKKNFTFSTTLVWEARKEILERVKEEVS